MKMRVEIENAGDFGKLIDKLGEAYQNLMQVVNRIRTEFPYVELKITDDAGIQTDAIEQRNKSENTDRSAALFDRLVKANDLQDGAKVRSTYGVDKPADGCKSV